MIFVFDGNNVELVDNLDYHQGRRRMSSMLNPAHPGEVLREYRPQDLAVADAAKRLSVTCQALSTFNNGRATVSASTAPRLEATLLTSAEMWLAMQTSYEPWQARKRCAPKVARSAARSSEE